MTRELVAIGEATGEPPASMPPPLATGGVTAAAAPAAAAAAITGAAVSAIVPSTFGSPPSSSTASVAALMCTASVTKASGADPTSRQAPGALSAVSNLAASLLREPALTLIAGAANAHATPAINLKNVRSTVGGSDAVMMRLLTKFRETWLLLLGSLFLVTYGVHLAFTIATNV